MKFWFFLRNFMPSRVIFPVQWHSAKPGSSASSFPRSKETHQYQCSITMEDRLRIDPSVQYPMETDGRLYLPPAGIHSFRLRIDPSVQYPMETDGRIDLPP